MLDAEYVLQSKPGKKSLKNAFVIYTDLECLLINNNHVIIILISHIQQQKHYINLQDTLY